MNKDSCSFMNVPQYNALVYDYFCLLFLLYRRYISYRLLLPSKIFIFELEAIPFWYRLFRAENESAIKCWPGIRITYHITFYIKSQTINEPMPSILLSETELLKKFINSESHLQFDSAFTYVALNSSSRLNAYFSFNPMADMKPWLLLKQTLRADRLHRLLAFIADLNEASFP